MVDFFVEVIRAGFILVSIAVAYLQYTPYPYIRFMHLWNHYHSKDLRKLTEKNRKKNPDGKPRGFTDDRPAMDLNTCCNPFSAVQGTTQYENLSDRQKALIGEHKGGEWIVYGMAFMTMVVSFIVCAKVFFAIFGLLNGVLDMQISKLNLVSDADKYNKIFLSAISLLVIGNMIYKYSSSWLYNSSLIPRLIGLVLAFFHGFFYISSFGLTIAFGIWVRDNKGFTTWLVVSAVFQCLLILIAIIHFFWGVYITLAGRWLRENYSDKGWAMLPISLDELFTKVSGVKTKSTTK